MKKKKVGGFVKCLKRKIEREVDLSMLKGFKYRIYPNKEQIVQIEKTFGSCRFVYNQLLAKKIDLYKNEQKSMSKTDCNNYCNRILKNEYEWLKEVDKFALTNSIYDLDTAYKNFFRRVKQGNEKVGFPKFKSKKNHYYSYKTNFTNNNIKVDFDNNKVQLPKLKWVKCKLHRKFTGKILFVTISKTPSNKYFISFNVEYEHEILPKNNNAVGIDLGIKDLLITSDGYTIENRHIIEKYEKKLKGLNRWLSRSKVGSKNRYKIVKKIQTVYKKLKNARKYFLHSISNKIVKENDVIVTEKLQIQKMVQNKNLSKKIYDVSWYELIRQLEYKSKWKNKQFYQIDTYYPSSQICSRCGYQEKKAKDLSIRKWECKNCTNQNERDINASINIMFEGIKKYIKEVLNELQVS